MGRVRYLGHEGKKLSYASEVGRYNDLPVEKHKLDEKSHEVISEGNTFLVPEEVFANSQLRKKTAAIIEKNSLVQNTQNILFFKTKAQ